jgi:hypothetical protein
MDEKILERKIEAAKKDRDVWKRFSKIRGQMKDDNPQFEPSFSCKLVRNPALPDGYTYCKNEEFGKCVFYRCKDRPSYLGWLEHHRQFHPKDDHLYVACNECRILRDKEVDFMDGAISDLKRKLKKGELIRSLADIAKNRIMR